MTRSLLQIRPFALKCWKTFHLRDASWRSFHKSCSLHGKIVPFKLSDIGEGIKEVELKEWFISADEEVAQFDDICEVQSDKASVTITSRFDGIVRKLYYSVGDVAQVGDPLVDIEVEGGSDESQIAPPAATKQPPTAPEQPPTAPEQPPAVAKQPAVEQSAHKSLATPAVRHLAKTNSLDINKIFGSGQDGRVLKEDIWKIVQQDEVITSTQQPMSVEDRVEKIKGIRKAMWSSMTTSLTIPHFGYDDEYDVTKLVAIRKSLKDETKRLIGRKISFLPFILKATSLALLEYPILNAHIDVENESIIYKVRDKS